ncbi:MAG: hypothetical protein M3314_15420, partial [Actinomycetota bacterium]|nr:hypothetical protein [Actinomycetota bacterium]
LNDWFRGRWARWAEDVLLDPEGIFERDEVERILALQRDGCSNAERIYALVLFELWRREYRVEVPNERAANVAS